MRLRVCDRCDPVKKDMIGGAAVLLERASFRYVDESERAEVEASFANGSAEAFGSRVDDVSLAVLPGRCMVLCGRSGSGKSTVLRMINGLAGTFFPGTLTGAVALCGTEVYRLTARERTEGLGVVMQDPRSQFFMSTVGDEIAFSADNLGVEPEETTRRVNRTATICGIEDLLGEKLSELSSGQKQRVALAAALACDPCVLVLDEPTSNLDKQGSEALISILADLKREGVALVISEHRLHRFLPIADSYACMRDGRVVARWDAQTFSGLSADEVACFGLRHPDTACNGGVSMSSRRESGSDDPSAVPGSIAPGDMAIPEMQEESAAGGRLHPGAISVSRSQELSFGEERHGWCVESLQYLYPSTRRGICAMTAFFESGKVTVIEGENGTGKTTLAKVLCGAVKEQAGRVMLDGRPVPRRERRRRSYFVMQDADYQLYAGSVADEVVLGRKVDDALKARAWEALGAFGLADLADRHPASLSGGQKQRVTLAAAYCSDAELVVLDEPTSGLDGQGVAEVASWCHTLAHADKTVVIITHDALLAKLAGDAVVTLERSTTP